MITVIFLPIMKPLMAKSNKAKDYYTFYDKHIIDALLKLKFPIIGLHSKSFILRKEARNESGIEHIARKKHRLKVRDIESVPSILKHPQYMCDDPDNRVYKNYYGIRKGEKQNSFIKIVTSPQKNNKSTEEIVTIYPTNEIKVEKANKKR